MTRKAQTITVHIDASKAQGVDSLTIPAAWVGEWLAVHRPLDNRHMGECESKGWAISHLLTGCKVMGYELQRMSWVIAQAQKLETLGQAWNFTDPLTCDKAALAAQMRVVLAQETQDTTQGE